MSNNNKSLLSTKNNDISTILDGVDEAKDGILLVDGTTTMTRSSTQDSMINDNDHDQYYGYQPTRKFSSDNDSSDYDIIHDDDGGGERLTNTTGRVLDDNIETDDDDDDTNVNTSGRNNSNDDDEEEEIAYTDIRTNDYDDDDDEEEEEEADETEYLEDDDDDDDYDGNVHNSSSTNRNRKNRIDTWTLRQTIDRGCKYLDIGTAVLPGPLFTADVEDYDGSDILQDVVSSLAETHYARLVRQEFNSIVIEHHMKWSPLLSIDLHPPNTNTATSTSTSSANNKNTNTGMQPSHTRQQSATTNKTMSGTNTATASVQSSLAAASTAAVTSSLMYQHPTMLPPTDQPRLGRYDFYYADSIVDWAIQKGNIKKIKGHVLVWHVTSPIKILEELTTEQVREELKRHIYTVMNHFRGRVTTWDVVNEALAPDGSLADTIFLRKLGPSYIEDCFRWAHEADPTAILLYNDNKVEQYGCQKADGFYQLLADLKSKNVPINGCGVQCHWNAAGTGVNRPPTPRMFKQQLRRLGKLGLTVNISELDVRVSKLGEDRIRRSIAQRQIYYDLIAAAVSEPAVDGIWLWGFTDRHTWVSNFYYDDEPLIFDEYYQRKPSYYGLRDALATLTPGHVVAGMTIKSKSSSTSTTTVDPTTETTVAPTTKPTLGERRRRQQQQQQEQVASTDGNKNSSLILLSVDSQIPQYPTIPIESDADNNGNSWGHEWMLPEPEVDLLLTTPGGGSDDNALPDWELPDSSIATTTVLKDNVVVSTNTTATGTLIDIQ